MKNKTLIATLRKQKGWTQENLADECNLSIRTIQRLESGKDANINTLSLIATALNVQISDLFESIEDTKREEEIIGYGENKKTQSEKKSMFKRLYTLTKIIFILLMLCLSTVMKSGLIWITWALLWPIGFFLLHTLNKFWITPLLNKKYPLAK